MKPKINRTASMYKPAGYDQCQTPTWALHALLKYIPYKSTVWECASGEGYLSKALLELGYDVYSTELDYLIQDFVYYPDLVGFNFLTDTNLIASEIDYIVTNPPYSGKMKQEFSRRCLYYYINYGIAFALLMPVEFIGTSSAQRLFKDTDLQMIYMNTRIDFKMPNVGWTGKSTNKKVLNKKGELVNQPGAQFPTAWYCVGLELPRDIMFEELSPYLMENVSNENI